MLKKYEINGSYIDSLDLKSMIVSRGIKVNSRIYKKFGKSHRIHPDPLRCNCLILPDGTIIHITDLAFHLKYFKTELLLNSIKQFKYLPEMDTPFSLDISNDGKAELSYKGNAITEIAFPKASQFYTQKTSSNLPFIGNAVLQGNEWLSFQCLWPCDYACSGYPCQFCYSGGMFWELTRKKKALPTIPTPRDVAEIIDFTIIKNKYARSIQLTGGSTFNTQAECSIIKKYLDEINLVVDRNNIPGEILIYTTPPNDSKEIDQLFLAGATRIACSLEVWDKELAKKITPGKIKFAGRNRYLDCLEYISGKYGRNKACSSFVIGIEPPESFLEGAEYLASKGIVPVASVWIPFGKPVLGKMKAPDLNFYHKVKQGLAKIYFKYSIEPPGGSGLNVCMCRDTWNHKEEIIEKEQK